MDAHQISNLIIGYRYWILIPLTFIEGPVVAFIAGTLASLNYFNVYGLAVLFFIRDIGMDGVYYCLGYFGGRTDFSKKMLEKIKITENHLNDVKKLWEQNPGKTMFIGKLSYGIASAFIVVAGMVKMPLKQFFKYGVLVAISQYGTLLLLGYYFGNAFGNELIGTIENIQYFITISALVISIFYGFSWYMRGKFMKEER